MFIVKHKPSGKYFKRGHIRSMWDATLVERDKATVFSSTSGVLNCLGRNNWYETPSNGYRRIRSKKVLDVDTWEMEEVTLTPVN